jgi:hypothetical protein
MEVSPGTVVRSKAVQTISLYAVVGEDRKLTIRLPASIPPGPVEVVVVVRPSEKQPVNPADYYGLGKEIWEGIDAQEYVNELRGKRTHEPDR